MSTIDKASAAILSAFQGAAVELEQGPSGNIYGQVVSGSFEGRSDHERVQSIYGALQPALSDAELASIVLILGLTPAERQSVDDDAA